MKMNMKPTLEDAVTYLEALNPSPRYRLNRADGRKMLYSLGLGLAGFALTYAASVVSSIDWANTGKLAFIGAMAPVLINYLRKLLAGPRVSNSTLLGESPKDIP